MENLVTQLAVFQVALPLAVICGNWLVPVASRLGLILRALAVLVMLFYLALAGLWLFPPWWTPYAMMLLHGAVVIAQWDRVRGGAALWRGLEAGVGVMALAGAVVLIAPVMQGRTAPEGVLDLAQPLGPGRYLVLSGGADPSINAHYMTLNLERATAFRGQSHGVDIIAIDAFGLRAPGVLPPDPALYEIYGRTVLAPCSGEVIALWDGVMDNPVPQMNRSSMTGNSVVIDCAGRAVVLAHFAPGSLQVALGDVLATGDEIARVGNTGNSGEPHLHVHVQTLAAPAAPLSGEPLHFTIAGEMPVRNMRFVAP